MTFVNVIPPNSGFPNVWLRRPPFHRKNRLVWLQSPLPSRLTWLCISTARPAFAGTMSRGVSSGHSQQRPYLSLRVQGGPCTSAGGFMDAAVSAMYGHMLSSEEAGIKCLEDLFIMPDFVILLLKLLRIKSYFCNKSEYERGNVVKCQNVVSSKGRRSYRRSPLIMARSPCAAQLASWVPHASDVRRKMPLFL